MLFEAVPTSFAKSKSKYDILAIAFDSPMADDRHRRSPLNLIQH